VAFFLVYALIGRFFHLMADLLIPVPYDALSIASPLAYALYSQSGETLYSAGHHLTSDELVGPLRQLTAYRRTQELPRQDFFNHEGYLFHFTANLSEEERQSRDTENTVDGLLDPALTGILHGPLAAFWDRLNRGATPDVALCEVVRDKLIAEVTNKVDQIQYLSQFRVRDEFTYSHILDVTALSIALAMKAGFSRQEVGEIAMAAILHDLGKLLIPRNIMFKPSRLSEKEFQVMKLHPELGYKLIVQSLRLPEPIARPALEHQEMYGGSGYPQGLSKDDIHPYSHIVKIADVYDALTSKRPYKESIASAKALQIMLSEGAKSFHPEFLRIFTRLSNHYDPTQVAAKAS
jgi:HD-GYP domain-containing protein (c-di-GMP phosphodiesterase class II)